MFSGLDVFAIATAALAATLGSLRFVLLRRDARRGRDDTQDPADAGEVNRRNEDKDLAFWRSEWPERLRSLEIEKFRVVRVLHYNRDRLVMQAQVLAEAKPIILKVVSIDHPSLENSLQREFLALEWLRMRSAASDDHGVRLVGDRLSKSVALQRSWIPGSSLKQYLATISTPVAISEVDRLVSSLGEQIRAAHKAGIIHCDVKPSNVIANWSDLADSTREFNCHLIDFGLATPRAPQPPTLDGVVITISGTLGFTAPERMYLSTALPASDVYSLARVAIFMLTSATERGREIPASLYRLLAQATNNNPLHRVKSIEDFLRKWNAAINNSSENSVPLSRRASAGVSETMRTIEVSLHGDQLISSNLKLTNRAEDVSNLLAELEAVATRAVRSSA